MSGVNKSESQVTCPAAGGSFLLEMGLLSRLTGKPEYEQAARRATKALWERRSSIGLLGSMIDVRSGKWLQTHSVREEIYLFIIVVLLYSSSRHIFVCIRGSERVSTAFSRQC